MADLKRNDIVKINQLLEIFPVILILGVRQCGKTTLAKQARPQWKYFNLENISDFDFINDNSIPFGIVINNANEVRMLNEKIIQIPAVLI